MDPSSKEKCSYVEEACDQLSFKSLKYDFISIYVLHKYIEFNAYYSPYSVALFLNDFEEALSSIKEVKQCSISLVKFYNYRAIVAYYQAACPVKQQLLWDKLRKHLPYYMLPNVFIELEEFPLTTSGKIDKQALPEPKLTRPDNAYVAPVSDLEVLLCNHWSQFLELPQVGATDDFFELGGSSIQAMQSASQLSWLLDRQVSVADIFTYRTARGLLEHVSSQRIVIPKSAQQRPKLSSSQQRLWFVEQYEQGSYAYHVPMLFKVASSIDVAALESALLALIDRHEVLRTTFSEDELGQAYQVDAEFIDNTKHTTSFEISVVISETEFHYGLSLNYREELFEISTVEHLLHRYVNIIHEVVENLSNKRGGDSYE